MLHEIHTVPLSFRNALIHLNLDFDADSEIHCVFYGININEDR